MMSAESTIFARFEKINKDGKVVKFKIQNLRLCDVDKFIDFISKWYVYEETFARCSGVSNSPDSTKEFLQLLRDLIVHGDGHCLICCLDDSNDDTQIVGSNLMYHKKKSDPELNFDLKTNEVKQFFKIIDVLHSTYNELEEFNVEEYIGGAGLSVHPEYRGMGIATELLKARKPMLLKLGVHLTGAWMTSIGSQKAAQKAGYEEATNMSFEELEKLCGINFSDVPEKTVFAVIKV